MREKGRVRIIIGNRKRKDYVELKNVMVREGETITLYLEPLSLLAVCQNLVAIYLKKDK